MKRHLIEIVASLVLAMVTASATAQQAAAPAVPATPASAVPPTASASAPSAGASAPAKSKVAKAYLPMMARKAEGATTPKALAEQIREALKLDATGNRRVRGTNATPTDFLIAVKKSGGTVDGVGALPTYIESLVEGDMPEGKITMSRMVYTRDKNGMEKVTRDVDKGFPREARMGERGWYDANTNLLILAGDCGNTPLTETKGPTAKPKLSVDEKPSTALTPAVPAASASTSVAPAPAPAAPATTTAAAVPDVCVKQVVVHVWKAMAASLPNVQTELQKEKTTGASLSAKFGDLFLSENAAGRLDYDTGVHHLTVVQAKTGKVFFDSRVVGKVTIPNPVGDLAGDELILYKFGEAGAVMSPHFGFVSTQVNKYRPCISSVHAIAL